MGLDHYHGITAVMFSGITIYHTFFVPRAKADAEKETEKLVSNETKKKTTTEEIVNEFARTFNLYFKKTWGAARHRLYAALSLARSLLAQDG